TRIPWDQKEELSTGTGETLLTFKMEVFQESCCSLRNRSLWESAQKDELSDSFGKALTTKPECLAVRETPENFRRNMCLLRNHTRLLGPYHVPSPLLVWVMLRISESLQKDLSPISLKALLTLRSSLGICALGVRYNCSLNTVARLSGASFRVRANLQSSVSKKWTRLRTIYSKPPSSSQLPLECLNDFNCLLGMSVFEGEAAMNEYTFYRNWVESWLQHIHPSLSKLFEIEICAHSWKRSTFDQQVFKFGLLWECVDIARSRTVYWQCALGTGHIQAFLGVPRRQQAPLPMTVVPTAVYQG
ncbi:unnamed protein product, partial [Thlaspi arvense]